VAAHPRAPGNAGTALGRAPPGYGEQNPVIIGSYNYV